MKRDLSFLVLVSVCVVAMAKSPAVIGDVNSDGNVTAADITEIYNYLLNGDMAYFGAIDVNGDGKRTAADVTAVYDILLGGVQPPTTHEYVDLGLPSGTLWATMNIGASCPEDYGEYFAWGETTPQIEYLINSGYHIYDSVTYKWNKFDSDLSWDFNNISYYFFIKYNTNPDYGLIGHFAC